MHEAMLHQCPDENLLLAYTRNQKIENPRSIRRHIEGCLSCRQKCAEYERLNTTLDVLASVQNNLSYPEPLAYEVFDVIHGGMRQRRKKPINKISFPSIRLAFIPIALLLTIGTLILVTAMAAFAFTHTGNRIPNGNSQLGGGLRSSATTIAQEQPTPRPKPTAPVPALALSPTPTVDPTPAVPYIKMCSSPEDIAHSIMIICGYHFVAGDPVALLLKMPGAAKPKQRPPVVVDTQGNFQDSFSINNCKLPLAIFARDLNSQVSSSLLQNISFGNCSVLPSSGGAV